MAAAAVNPNAAADPNDLPPGATLDVGVAAPEAADKQLLIDRPTNPYLYTTPTGIPVYGPGAPVLYRAPAPPPSDLPPGATPDLPPGATADTDQPPPPPSDEDQRSLARQALDETLNLPRQIGSATFSAAAGVQHILGNAAMILDRTQGAISDMTGMSRGDFFRHIENWARANQQYGEQQAQEWSGGRQDFNSQLFRTAASIPLQLPTYGVATAAAGGNPILGMAGLSALETADQGPKAAAIAAAQGAATGGMMEVMGPASRPIRLGGTALATYASLKAQGVDNETALANALGVGAFSALPPGQLSTGQTLKTMAGTAGIPLPNQIRILPAMFPNKNAAEREAMQYMAQQGVHVDAPAAAGSRFLGGVKRAAEATPIGAMIGESGRRRTIEGVRNLTDRMVGQISPETPPGELYDQFYSAENAPSSTRQVPTGAKDDEGKPVMEDMQMPVNVGQLKPSLQPIYDQMQWMPMADRNSSAGYRAVERILHGPDYIPASQAETGLSGIKNMIRTGEGRNRGLASFIAPKLQELIDGSVQDVGGDDAVRALQRGRVAAAKQAGADWLSDVFNKAKAEGAFNRQDALWNQWLNLPMEAKRTMYTPRQLADLNKLFLGAKALFRNVNPSGTAQVAAIAHLLEFGGHPLAVTSSVIGGAALAKLLDSKLGVKLLTEGLTIGGDTPRARQISRQLHDIVEEEPPEPPTGPAPAGGGGSPAAGGSPTPASAAPEEPAQGLLPFNERMQNMADEAMQRMRKRGTFDGTKLNALVPVDDMKDMAIWGAAKIAQGVKNRTAWGKEILDDVGEHAERFRPLLPQLWLDSQKAYDRFLRSTSGLPNTRQLIRMFNEGRAGAEWYDKTREELHKVFGPKDGDLMIRLLAATSPNTTVPSNVTLALKAFQQMKAGEDFHGEGEQPGYLPVVKDMLRAIRDGGDEDAIGGLKVQSFRKNLLGETDPVTIDRWMKRIFNFKSKGSITDPQYKFMDYQVTRLAKQLDMQPRQVQAALWKAIRESSGETSSGAPFEELIDTRIKRNPVLRKLVAQSKGGKPTP